MNTQPTLPLAPSNQWMEPVERADEKYVSQRWNDKDGGDPASEAKPWDLQKQDKRPDLPWVAQDVDLEPSTIVPFRLRTVDGLLERHGEPVLGTDVSTEQQALFADVIPFPSREEMANFILDRRCGYWGRWYVAEDDGLNECLDWFETMFRELQVHLGAA